MLDKIIEVVAVYEHNGTTWYESKHLDEDGEAYYGGGILGGLEPVC